MIDGTTHRTVGLLENGVQIHGVVNAEKLVHEVDGLLRQGLNVFNLINLATFVEEENEIEDEVNEISDCISSDDDVEHNEKNDSSVVF